jgi:hypothetical protein
MSDGKIIYDVDINDEGIESKVQQTNSKVKNSADTGSSAFGEVWTGALRRIGAGLVELGAKAVETGKQVAMDALDQVASLEQNIGGIQSAPDIFDAYSHFSFFSNKQDLLERKTDIIYLFIQRNMRVIILIACMNGDRIHAHVSGDMHVQFVPQKHLASEMLLRNIEVIKLPERGVSIDKSQSSGLHFLIKQIHHNGIVHNKFYHFVGQHEMFCAAFSELRHIFTAQIFIMKPRIEKECYGNREHRRLSISHSHAMHCFS